MLVPIEDMLREHGNEFHWCATAFEEDLSFRVLAQVNNFLCGHFEYAFLRNGKPADVTPGVSKEMLL
jgi:hypothetical protein